VWRLIFAPHPAPQQLEKLLETTMKLLATSPGPEGDQEKERVTNMLIIAAAESQRAKISEKVAEAKYREALAAMLQVVAQVRNMAVSTSCDAPSHFCAGVDAVTRRPVPV
jgi:hypothetical protein